MTVNETDSKRMSQSQSQIRRINVQLRSGSNTAKPRRSRVKATKSTRQTSALQPPCAASDGPITTNATACQCQMPSNTRKEQPAYASRLVLPISHYSVPTSLLDFIDIINPTMVIVGSRGIGKIKGYARELPACLH